MSYMTFIELGGVIVLGNCNRSFRFFWETYLICMQTRAFCWLPVWCDYFLRVFQSPHVKVVMLALFVLSI